MALLDCANKTTVWNGFECYDNGKVLSKMKIGVMYRCVVSDDDSNEYTVEMNPIHPRKSKCSCPRAKGKYVICKHVVAAYFSVFPMEAKKYGAKSMNCEKIKDIQEDELYLKIQNYVREMKKSELQSALLQLLMESPEVQFDRFLTGNGLRFD